jgi:hypothetical protein
MVVEAVTWLLLLFGSGFPFGQMKFPFEVCDIFTQSRKANPSACSYCAIQ